MAAPGNEPLVDLSQLVSSLQHHHQVDPLVVDSNGTLDTQGMSFQELFSHYLAPEVAKLPPASAAPEPPLPFTFGDDANANTSNAVAGPSSAASTFDPSTFMPTIPGSPIGAFSPSSDGNSSHRSPMSFPDLDFSATSDPFAIDPSIFSASAGLDYGGLPPVDAMDASTTCTPATSAASETPLASLPNAPLPPLPSLPLAPAEVAPIPTPAPSRQQTSWGDAPPTIELTASGRPKRNVAHSVLDATGDEDDDMYSSDGSSATTTRRSSTRATSRKPPAAKKARATSGTSESAAAAAAAAAADAAAKRLVRTSVVPLASSDLHKTTANSKLPPVPQWADKPDPAEYSKLSSKEKRQMRNKISARNFRHRRKEYITTLEEEISSRDTIISELRDEVGVIRAENTGLRTEVATLKEKWQDLLDKLSALSGPVAAPAAGTAAAGLGTNVPRAVAAASSSGAPALVKEEGDDFASLTPEPSTSTAARRIGTRSGGVARPNLSKDVSALGRRNGLSRTGSWTTAGAFGGAGAGGGFTSVHTTLLPDVNLADGLHAKPHAPPFAAQSFNPALNALNASQLADLPAMTAHLRGGLAGVQQGQDQQGQQQQQLSKGTFEDFFASNPYWLRSDQLDQNRAALYGKLANNAAGLVAAQAKSSQQEGYLPVPAGFRPAFFRSSSSSSSDSPTPAAGLPAKSSTAAELLAFQSPATAASLAAPPTTPTTLSHQDATLGAGPRLEQQQQHSLLATARVAALARETLASRMWGAFVDAFAGAPTAPGAGAGAGGMSADKVAAVLGGRARVEVVPVVAAPAAATMPEREGAGDVEALGAQLGGMSLARAGSPVAASAGGRGDERECAFESVVGRWLGGAAPKRA